MNNRKMKHADIPDRKEADGRQEHLPPRILKHAGKKSKVSRYYSIALFWLFFILIAILIVWGYRNT